MVLSRGHMLKLTEYWHEAGLFLTPHDEDKNVEKKHVPWKAHAVYSPRLNLLF